MQSVSTGFLSSSTQTNQHSSHVTAFIYHFILVLSMACFYTGFYEQRCFRRHNNRFHFIVKSAKSPIRCLERKIRLSIYQNKPLSKLIKRHYHPSCALIRLCISACNPFKGKTGASGFVKKKKKQL